jgi:hypothetical protein
MQIQEQVEVKDLMKSLEVVLEENSPANAASHVLTQQSLLWQWLLGAMLVLLIGSWFIWLSAYLQRMFIEEDIRAACQRVMPDTVQRCIDTVIIQRGGAKR